MVAPGDRPDAASRGSPTTAPSSRAGRGGQPRADLPVDGFATFILSATIGSFAVELVYLILAVAAFGLVRQAGNKWWQYAVVAVAVVTPMLGYYGALKPEPHDRSNVNWEAIYWTIGVVVVAVVWFVVLLVIRRVTSTTRHPTPPSTTAWRRWTRRSDFEPSRGRCAQ